MKSIIINFSPLTKKIKRISDILYEDKLTVFAAQTSFYICISAIPFIMLLLSLSRAVAPAFADDMIDIIRGIIPENSIELFDRVCAEISAKADIPLISSAAVTTLWSASRGMHAVLRGVSEVYKTQKRGFFFINIIRSLVYTVLFIAAIVSTLLLLVFDSGLRGAMLAGAAEGGDVIRSVVRFKGVILFFVLIMLFTVLYHVVAKGTLFLPRGRSNSASPDSLAGHIPGAALAALGWLLFSFFYSLYIKHFSKFSYIYGSLTAVVFLMLWMYFCIVILLAGAELNKMLADKN